MSDPRLPRDHAQTATTYRSRRQEAVIALLRSADVLRRRYAELFEPYGITLQQYNVLRILRGARSPLPTMDIVGRMIERAPGITRLLDRLDEKGLVSRERCVEDRRQVLCSISGGGLRLLEQLDDPVDLADEAALAMLDDGEVETLIRLLGRVCDEGEP